MKNEQQQQAKNLYFQTNLSKTEIAEMLNVNRRTVMLWVQQGNWDRLKMAGQHLPSMIVEKCYYMLNHYLDNLLSVNNVISTFGPKEAAAINSLASSIKKVRTRSAVNESMEMFNYFLEDVKRKDPAMATAIRPMVEEYIAKRKDVNISDFLPAGFNEEGFVNYPEDNIMENWLDEEEQEKMAKESAAERESAARNNKDEGGELVESNHQPDMPSSPAFGTARTFATKAERPVSISEQPAIPYFNFNDPQTRRQSQNLAKGIEKQLTAYLKNQNAKVA